MNTIQRLLLPAATVILWPVSPLGAQEAVSISGRVTNGETGGPLAGVSVYLLSSRAGAQTDADGRYTFTLAGARATGNVDTLTARRIGFQHVNRAVTLTPGARITQDFVMTTNPLMLGEVVITGAGTATTRERLGNVINSVDSMEVTRTVDPNIVQSLAGKAPNVEVTEASGDPGASSFIRIRGAKTIEGNGEPLIVVDGVPIDNTTIATGSFLASTAAPNRAADIDPSDVASVDILKGAAAAAIYGARAANGVVLITTKSGQAGAPRVTFTVTGSAQNVNASVPLQTTFGQGDNGEGVVCDAPGCRLSPNSYGPRLNGAQTYDHFDEMFRTGSLMDYNLSMSGGNDRTLFYMSGGYTDHAGVVVGPNNEYQRTTARLKASHFVTDAFQVGGNIAYVDTRGDFTQKGSNISGLMLGALRSPPDFNNREYLATNGLHRSYRFPDPDIAATGRGYDNPFWVVNEHTNQQNVNRAYGNIELKYTPKDWLDFRYLLGADYYTDRRLEGLPISSSDRPTGRVISADFTNYSLDHNLSGTARWTMMDNIDASFTAGQNLNSRRFRQLYVTGFDLVAPTPYQLDNTVTRDPDEFTSLVHVESYYGQLELAWKSTLFATLAARNDGFSTFGASEKRHWFPKASLAWEFSQSFNPDRTGMFSYGKLRAAYGQTGRPPEAYTTIQAFSGANLLDGGWGPVLSPTYAGNGGLTTSDVRAQEDIGPERTNEFEVGTDLAFFDNKVDMGLTYYDAKSENVIFQAPLSPSSGFAQQARNAATITNKGFEASINFRPIMSSSLTWEIGAIYGTNTNKVVDLQGAEFVDMPGAFAGAPGAAVVGSKVGVLRGNDFARCGRGLTIDGVDIDGSCGTAPAGALYIGADGFPILDPTIRVIMDPHPDWTGSLRTRVALGSTWEFGAMLDARQGQEIWNGTKGALYQFGTHKDTEIRDTEQVFGQGGFHSGAVGGPGAGQAVMIDQGWFQGLGSGFGPVASQFIEDGSFVKLREVSVAYHLTAPWVRNVLSMSSLEIRLAGRNLFTWTDYSGIDPETNLGGAEVNLQGIDYFNNPSARTFVLMFGLSR